MSKFRQEYQVIAYSIVGAVLFWIADAIADSMLLYNAPFLNVLFLNKEEVIFRLIFCVFFLIFGYFMARVLARQKRTEQVLQKKIEESEAAAARVKERDNRQRAILNNIPDIAWLKDRDGRFIAVNEAFAKSVNLAAEEIAGKTDLDVWQAELAEVYRADDQEVMQTGRRKRIEEPLTDHSGSFRWIETIKTPFFDEKGEVAGTTGIARDITERKRMETVIRESEERYRVLAENAQDGIIMIDDKSTILLANAAAEAIFGWSIPEILGKKMTMLMPEAMRSTHLERVRAHAETGKRTLPSGAVQVPGLHRSGREIPLEISFGEFVQNGRYFFIGILRDVTERARVQEALKKREEELETITANMAEGLYVLDQAGTVTFMNPEAERLLGWSKQELNEKGAHEAIHYQRPDGTALPRGECRMQQVFATGERYYSNGEVFVRRDGTVFPISVITSPVAENGAVVAVITAFQDITGLRRSEDAIRELNQHLQRHTAELERAYRDMESFSYAVSHDLKAPVIRIHGFVKIILEEYGETLQENVREMLGRIEHNAAHMLQLIGDLLTFFRYGGKKVEKTHIDIAALATLIFQELKADAAERKIRFELHTPPPAYCDAAMIRQVLLNLIANAMKFTRTREETHIEFGGYEEEERTVYYVRDNGIGFDPRFADRLFGLFQRIHTSKAFEGTGVGLVIVKKIIESHDGRVWAEGKPDAGASFFFSLPRG